MRHATRTQRLSRPSEHRKALIGTIVKGLVLHEQVRTTLARAKEAQRCAERIVTLGKDGSIHSRRQAFRVLQDRTLVKRLFADIAPRFMDVSGGYTRITKLAARRGDGAQQALLAFSRLPAAQPTVKAEPKPAQAPKAPAEPQKPQPGKAEEPKRSKGLFEGLRSLWTKKKNT